MKKIIGLIVITGIIIWIAVSVFFFAVNRTVNESMPVHSFELYEPGKNIVDYEKYGEFQNVGTENYKYVVKDKKELADVVGEGIFPNTSIYKDPVYKQLVSDKKLNGSHWDFMYPKDIKLAFYKWATASEDPGVKQFYTALALENAGLIAQAIKAYYAVLVHYPKTISYTYWNTPWYPSKTAIAKILYLTRKYPFLGMKLEGSSIDIENGYNLDPLDDKFIVNPGKLKACKPSEIIPHQDRSRLVQIEHQIGYGDVNLLKYKSGDWQFIVKGKPFIVKAVAYTPAKIGQSPDEGTLEDWMKADYNNNGKIDGVYDIWVDKNKNNVQDIGENPIGDFELMKQMGVNTLRIYDHKINYNKEVLRYLHEKYGLMFIMGDFFGAYAVGSGTSWYRGTKYDDPKH
ncbi:MAG: hypothetical protein PHQ52_08440, partial [Candidatus Omnitrophica bacterium]|nr:hypothetical protein [Candidatus Omnitrophota bacterium]